MFKYPHGDLHGLNLDWLLAEWKNFKESFQNAFSAVITQIGVNDQPTVDVNYDQNSNSYEFDFGMPAQVKPSGFLIGYQESTSGTVIPTGSWLANPPTVAQGNYLWTKQQTIYNDGQTVTTYSVARMGIDGVGTPGTQTPYMDGTGAVGTSTNFAREDHVHPSDTSKLDASSFVLATATPIMDGTGAVGTSTNVAREDHVHPAIAPCAVLEWITLTYYSATQLRYTYTAPTIPAGYTSYRRSLLPVFSYDTIGNNSTKVQLSGTTFVVTGSGYTASDTMAMLMLTVFY